MNFLRRFGLLLSNWIDDVARAILAIGGLIRPKRDYLIVEQGNGEFLVQVAHGRAAPQPLGSPLHFVGDQFVEDAGNEVRSRLERGHIEIVLASRRFVFRTLELPRQASEFLEGIVRAQIDRLTPWSAAQAAFGCSPPHEASDGRIGVTVAATARSSIMPFVKAVEALKPKAIVVSAAPGPGGGEGRGRTVVFTQQTDREVSIRKLRRILVGAPAAVGLTAVAACAAWSFVGADLEESRLKVARQTAEMRASLLSGRVGPLEEATAKLARKKRESAAAVIVLESLSQALPDDTYLTELHAADGKLEITGVTREASALIGIIEQTDQFKNATFFAPTTRAPQEVGEQFHIEAQIAPYFPGVQ